MWEMSRTCCPNFVPVNVIIRVMMLWSNMTLRKKLILAVSQQTASVSLKHWGVFWPLAVAGRDVNSSRSEREVCSGLGRSRGRVLVSIEIKLIIKAAWSWGGVDWARLHVSTLDNVKIENDTKGEISRKCSEGEALMEIRKKKWKMCGSVLSVCVHFKLGVRRWACWGFRGRKLLHHRQQLWKCFVQRVWETLYAHSALGISLSIRLSPAFFLQHQIGPTACASL